MNLFFSFLILINIFNDVYTSLGDSFPAYQTCIEKCKTNQCLNDGYNFKNQGSFIFIDIFKWPCTENCRYHCMWFIVDMFERKNWPQPQFHGKWPFARFMGLQEPASVIFSLMNLAGHVIMFRKFRKVVRPNSPMYKVWFVFFAVCCNCWIWSAVFHSRDRPISEVMDYLSAFGMVFYSLYGTIMRMLVHSPIIIAVLFSLICISIYVNHALYLALEQFDYHYNMNANIFVGVLSSAFSILWCVWNWRLSQSRHLFAVVIIGALTTILEVSDFPPVAKILDAHALWHLSTVPIPYFFWKFAMEDCQYLHAVSKTR
uniref:Post-GPI attachment to proteins factor 3 n=1 Tax=Clastoptera arizonana TaxID=38151 RepID=A0A1B6E938_9HEMI